MNNKARHGNTTANGGSMEESPLQVVSSTMEAVKNAALQVHTNLLPMGYFLVAQAVFVAQAAKQASQPRSASIPPPSTTTLADHLQPSQIQRLSDLRSDLSVFLVAPLRRSDVRPYALKKNIFARTYVVKSGSSSTRNTLPSRSRQLGRESFSIVAIVCGSCRIYILVM